MWNRALLIAAGALGLLATGPGAAAAQVPGDSVLVYRREVFDYHPEGRPDPFRSLLNSDELGVRFEDLTLLGVLYNPDPARSVAVLAQRNSDRRIRARIGDRIGNISIVGIGPRSVVLMVEEFGVARRETLEITRAQAEQGRGT